MGVDLNRALLAGACALAVLLAGAALPASDYGHVPGSAVDVGDTTSDGTVTGTNETGTDTDGAEQPSDGTTTPQPATETPTATPPDGGSTPGAPAPGSDSTATPTATPTPTPDDEGGLVPWIPIPEIPTEIVPSIPTPEIPTDWVPAEELQFLLSLLLTIVFVAFVGWFVLVFAFIIIALPSENADDEGGQSGLELSDIEYDASNPFWALASRATSVTLQFPMVTIDLARTTRGAVSGTSEAMGAARRAISLAGAFQLSFLSSLFSIGRSRSVSFPSLSELVPDLSRGQTEKSSTDEATAGGQADGTDEDRDQTLSIADAWLELREMVPVRRYRALTPAEIARRAVEEEFPREPVGRLTELFRETAYGGKDRTDRRRREAVEALQSIRDERGGDRE